MFLKQDSMTSESRGICSLPCFSEMEPQTAKRWCITAIAVGILVVVGGVGFSTMGLLHSYGCISLPAKLASAIGTIGSSGLWGIMAGSLAIGGILIGLGSYKIHQAKKQQEIEENTEAFNRFFENSDFAELQEDPNDYQSLDDKTYVMQNYQEQTRTRYFVVIHNAESFKATRLMESAMTSNLLIILLKLGYQESSKKEAIQTQITEKRKQATEALDQAFGEKWDALQQQLQKPVPGCEIKPENYQQTKQGTFISYRVLRNENKTYCLRRNVDGNIQCTEILDQQQSEELAKNLRICKFKTFL